METAIGWLAVLAAAGLLAWTSLRDVIAFPFSDSHDWAAEVLRMEGSRDWAGYLWLPHNAQRMPWMRVAEALQIEVAGHPPAFWLMAVPLWTLGAAAFLVLLGRSGAVAARSRLWLGAGGLLLLTCGPLAEDFAFPISSIYLLGAGPAIAAACLWACAGSTGRLSPWRLGALACAVIASGGEAAALAVWPALIGAALLLQQDRRSLALLVGVGVACIVLAEAGLGAPVGAGAAASSGLARLIKMATYFGG